MGNQVSLDSEAIQDTEELDHVFDNNQTLEEESFEFLTLPFDLQRNIVEKFEYNQFAYFEQTSQLAHNICSSNTFSVPHEVSIVYVNKKKTKCGVSPRIPLHVVSRPPVQIIARIVAIKSRLTSGRIRSIINCFERNRTKVVHLMFFEPISWPVEYFDKLLKVTNPKYISFYQFLPSQYFTCPSLQNGNILKFESTGCSDEGLKNLKSDTFSLKSDFITSKGFNILLKQWIRRERNIKSITVIFGSNSDQIIRDDVLHGIEANLIWSFDSHEDSILHAIPLGELNVLTEGEYIYSIWVPEDPENTLFVHIGNISFGAWKDSGESEFLLRALNCDQYYTVRNECQTCLSEFCEHRRRYSTARLKTHFPIVYKTFMRGIRVMGYTLAVACTLNFISGERPSFQDTSYDYELIQEETGVTKFLSTLHAYLFNYV